VGQQKQGEVKQLPRTTANGTCVADRDLRPELLPPLGPGSFHEGAYRGIGGLLTRSGLRIN